MLAENGALQPDPKNTFNQLGLVSAAQFSDLNADGYPKLILACDWGPIRVFKNGRGQFQEFTNELGLGHSLELWTSITAADLDADGRWDIVAGNIGLNNFHQRAPEGPWFLYHGDLASSGELALLKAFHNPL